MHAPHDQLDALLAAGIRSGIGDAWYRIGALKLFADGTLGGRTAAMLAPYRGTTGQGMELIEPGAMRETVWRAIAGGISVAIHAIGDRAVRNALDAFEAAGSAALGLAFAPRIEHAQLVDAADLPRFARLGVVPSMQPAHLITDLPLARHYWGDRLEHAYPWADLDAGDRLLFGSDAPVEPPSVALGLHAAVARRPVGEPDAAACSPRQRLDLDRALRAYTRGGRLGGLGPGYGTLAPGVVADLVVWDRDLFAAPVDDLAVARPSATVVNGRVVFERPAGDPAVAPGRLVERAT